MRVLLSNLMYFWSKLLKKGRLAAVRHSTIDPTSKIESGSQIVHSIFDRHSFCGYDCDIFFADIGPFVSIANSVVIGGGEHPIQWVAMSPVFYEGPDSVKRKFSEHSRKPVLKTSVAADVWIGRNALLKSGITVGVGAVIGMGSIVTRDVPPYEIWAGNPARKIGERFDSQTRIQLLESRWWQLGDEQLDKIAYTIENPDAFLRALHDLEEN